MIAHNKSHWKQSCVVIGYLAGDFGTDGESVRDDWFFVCGLAIPAVQLNTATAAQQHLAIDLHRRLACELVTFRHTDIQTHRDTFIQTPAYTSPPTTCQWTGDLQTHRHTDTQRYMHTDTCLQISTDDVPVNWWPSDTQAYRHTEIHSYRHLPTDLHRRLACELVTFRHTDIQTAYLHSYRQTDNQTPAYRSPPTTCLWTGDLWTHTNMNMSCHAMDIKWCEQVVILITKFNSGKQSFINTG